MSIIQYVIDLLSTAPKQGKKRSWNRAKLVRPPFNDCLLIEHFTIQESENLSIREILCSSETTIDRYIETMNLWHVL